MFLGILFLIVIMLTFSISHMVKYDPGMTSVEIAGETCMIILAGVMVYVVLYFICVAL